MILQSLQILRIQRERKTPSEQSGSSLRKVREWVDDHKFSSNWDEIECQGWNLPATEEKHAWCGLWQTFGCLNEQLHAKLGKGKRNYIKQYQRSCYRPSCKECYLKWIARQANVATKRIEKYSEKSGKKPIHLMLMVPKSQQFIPYDLLKKRMNEILKITQWIGGSVIFHPFKFYNGSWSWYYSPHFHLVGFGSRFKIAEAFGKFGWYIKIGGERESVFQTFCYLLSKCGVKKRVHSLRWVGDLSYSKLKVEKEPKITCCPVCGGKFVQVYYDGMHPIVSTGRYFEGLVDSDGRWKTVPTGEWLGNEYYRFEYAPTRSLNEVLKSLAERYSDDDDTSD